jgi:hypothetical protein
MSAPWSGGNFFTGRNNMLAGFDFLLARWQEFWLCYPGSKFSNSAMQLAGFDNWINSGAAGYRYRLHVKDLPGKPGRRKVIFVHGCWLHGHDCKRGNRIRGQMLATGQRRFPATSSEIVSTQKRCAPMLGRC